MRTYADQLREEGKDEGIALGKTQGLRSSLEMLLEARFGSIPAYIQKVLEAADLDALNDWLRIAARAETLEEIGIRGRSVKP